MGINLVCISLRLFCIYLQITRVCSQGNVCSQSNDTEKCCSGYYKVNDTCQECIGSYGFNCSKQCPEGYYGPQCRIKCSCSAIEQCHNKSGCLGENFRDQENESFFKSLKLRHWVVLAVIVLLILVVNACYFASPTNRRVRIRERPERNNYIDQTLPQPASEYLGMNVTSCASTAYPVVSFQTKPIEDTSDYI
ncbi:N-acetylglucosamine-1-phosphodiester alpha-N-acetylglucosaminidase-like [Saccostrea cucullata]|uniref:N-acetylglucosamine-1-phosphodiester alpha-N-acetylglucosaminidase-like n=1 Tax=Saccostrea cuccullata TaxID=36930 RepID=UPI002ED0EF8C